ncbi:MAG: hypothetical protein Q8K98_11740, partial [Bacteroidota bacterium]|nr:hypothetical protein [Bacteroidota bacterium]
DESKGGEIANKLLVQSKPLLAVIDSILPVGNNMRDSIHDEIALCALSCEIGYVNKTNQWKHFIDTLQILLSIVAGGPARARIQENLKIGEESIEYGICFFCSENVPDASAAIEVKMHGNVIQEYEQVRWQYLNINVPRCLQCKMSHGKVENASTVGGVIGGLAGLGGCISVLNSNSDAWFGGLIVLILGSTIGILIGNYFAQQKLPKNIKPKSAYRGFKKIQELLKDGWSFGEKPP